MMRALASALVLLMSARADAAQSLDVSGQLGVLGEWEISATVTEKAHDGVKQFAGPLNLRHVGICSVDGPEEKTGELRLRLSSTSLDAALLIDGRACTFSARLKDGYSGVMDCPDRRPVPLTLWIK
jgi:hypothetical protein